MPEKIKILVVDDTSDIGVMMKLMLEYKGYSVTILQDPNLISSVLKNERPELIIMDMLLSGINGGDICRDLKGDNFTSSIPVIMMSGHHDGREKCLAAGADDFMDKPFEITELMSKVEGLTSMING